MKKIFWSFTFFVLSLGLVACSSLRSVGQVRVEPGDMHVVLLNTVDSKAASTKKSKTQFYYGDMVYAYMTLGWDQNIQARTIDVKWRNSAGAVMAEQDRLPKYTRDPHHVWFWINTAQLGKGSVSTEILIDGQSVKVIPFDIVDAKRYEAKTAWYQRLFKRKPTEAIDQTSEPTSEVEQSSNVQSQ